MELEGRIWRNKKYWLIEIPALDAMTQGRTRKEALEMIQDLIREMLIGYFPEDLDPHFETRIIDYKNKLIGVKTNSDSLVLALSLRRQKEKRELTVREAS